MLRLCLTGWLTLAVVLLSPMAAAESHPVEDRAFLPESAWNRSNGAVLFSLFSSGRASALEIAHEWAAFGTGHQVGYSVPLFRERDQTGAGDVTVSYRYQWIGAEGSRVAVAPRLSLLLPTRSERFGERSRGVELAVPVGVRLSERLVNHAAVGWTWLHDRREQEVRVIDSLVWSLNDRLAVSLDAAYTRSRGEDLVVLRPMVQMTFDTGAGVQVSPGIAAPYASGERGVLLFVAFETGF